MGKFSWNLIKTYIRRESAPPIPTPTVTYNPNSHRPEYIKAFDEFQQRGSLYNQLPTTEESEETCSQNTNTKTTTDHSDSTVTQPYQPKPGTSGRHSLPNQKTRSIFGGSPHRKTNTANKTLAVNENNNDIYVDEVLDFESNCINDSSFGATNQSPPKEFYKGNSHPFSPKAQRPVNIQSAISTAPIQSESLSAPIESATSKTPVESESSSAPIESGSSSPRKRSSSPRKTITKIEESRQRACQNLLDYLRTKADSTNSSNSSGAYRHNDLDSISLGGEDKTPKKSRGQDIAKNTYDEIVNAFGDMAQRNDVHDDRDTNNSPVPEPNNSPLPQTIGHELSGRSPLSAFVSFRRCEGFINENFKFLDNTECRKYCMDDSESGARGEPSIQADDSDATDLSALATRFMEHEQTLERHLHVPDSPTMCMETNQNPLYIISCNAKDIKPRPSSLRNSMATPFQLSSGTFRWTDVAVRKGFPRDSKSIRLVEEAMERDYEVLSKVKHPNIMMLMAASFTRELLNHMTLLMEPVDYTLHFYLHQMGKTFSILETIAIVQQISSAALYLQECGYIHSNISTHNVLFRERPFSVKLSSFELSTDADHYTARLEIEKCCPRQHTRRFNELSRSQQLSTVPEVDNVDLGQYKELSKRSATLGQPNNVEHDYMNLPSKYLVYDTTYRQHLSLHNFTAPELLATDQRFVYPTPETNVYSLCLLLWELLNQCVPFAVYNRLDMERMIAAKKLNLPFFERERCFFFMEIFSVGLAIQPEDRTIDIPHLIGRLEDIELEILTDGEYIPNESSDCNGENADHQDVNLPQQNVQNEDSNDSVPPSASGQSSNGNPVNMLNDFLLSLSSLDFNKSLTDHERTSTKKFGMHPTRQHVSNRIRQLFPTLNTVDDENAEIVQQKEQPSFVDLDDSFLEMSDDIRRHAFDEIDADKKLTENLAEMAKDIQRNILNDTEEFPSIEYQPNEVNTKVVAHSSAERIQSRKLPTVVGYSVKNKMKNDSKTQANLLETSMPITAARKLFDSSTDEGGRMHDFWLDFAEQNCIKRNELSKSDKNSEAEHMLVQNDKEADPVDANKKINVSVRIVHSKMTPEKAPRAAKVPAKDDNEGRPSILSKINFFNSVNQTSTTGTSLPNDKHSTAALKPDEVASSNRSTSSSNQTSTTGNPLPNDKHTTAAVKPDEVVSSSKSTSSSNKVAATDERKCADENVVSSGASNDKRKTIMTELTDTMQNLHNGPLDTPQKKQSFENKLWRREMDICNRSLNASDHESKNTQPKFQSVKNTILKFEKRTTESGSDSSSTSTASAKSAPKPKSPTESVKSASKNPVESVKNAPKSPSQSNHQKQNDSPTLIKRTTFSEQISSGINLSPMESPIFDKFNFGQKVGTRMSLRKVRQTSSDVGVNCGRGNSDVRQNVCGREVELLSLHANSFNSSGSGPSGAITVCFDCVTKMSSDELKALSYENFEMSTNSDSNQLKESPTKRCQARSRSQDTRSIEDLYIDDDFVHGLGANMELQSNYSDSLDFDMVSTGLY